MFLSVSGPPVSRHGNEQADVVTACIAHNDSLTTRVMKRTTIIFHI